MKRRVKMKLPTLNDIAREAGLSNCVVSHVLHNDAYASKVRPETRQRILAIAEKLGYRRNTLASATRTGRVNTIAVILNFDDLQNILPMNQIMSGIMVETAEHKYSVKVFSESDLAGTFQSIVENRIGKVISMSVDSQPRKKTAELAEKYALDLVYAYERGHRQFPAVNADNMEMTSHAVHYLAEHGHTRIGLFCTPHTHYFKIERHAGYLKGMEECGLAVKSEWISCSDDFEAAVDKIIGLPEKSRPTAFVAVSDVVAARAQRRAWQCGLRIPEQFSIIGIGDTESASAAMLPLTTFRETLSETGKLLVRLVLGEKPDFQPDEFNVYRTHAEIIERESVYTIDTGHKSQVSSSKSQVKHNKKNKSN